MFAIDLKSGLPIYEQLYRSVVNMVAAGGLEPGQAMPSVRVVAGQMGVNPNTVQKAYMFLERDGIIYSQPGKGSFVAEKSGAIKKQREQALIKLRGSLIEAMESGLDGEIIVGELKKLQLSRGEN